MIVSISIQCDTLEDSPADRIRCGVVVAKKALGELAENADLFSAPKGEEIEFRSEDVHLSGSRAVVGRISVAPGPRVLWSGVVDGARTRLVRPSPGATYAEQRVGRDDKDDATEADEDGEFWEACDDTRTMHVYEACLLSLIGDPVLEG